MHIKTARPPKGGPVPPPAEVRAAGTPASSMLSTVAITVVVVAALSFGREVFLPLVLAVLLSFVLAPLVNLIRRTGLGRVPSVIAAVVVALGILVGIGSIIGSQVAELSTNLPRYRTTIEQKIEGLQEGVLGQANRLLRRLSHQVATTTAPDAAAPQPEADSTGAPAEKPLLVRVQEAELSPLDIARRILGPVIEPLTTIGIVLVVLVFLLLQREDLRDRMIRLVGASDLHRTTVAMSEAAERLSTFFLAQLGINLAFGVLIGAGLWLIGVPNPVLWGVFSALMRFVPYIGAFISGLLPLALAAAVDPGWSMALMTAALFVVAEPLTGQVIEPLLYGHSTGLSPFAVVVSALFWGFLWGPAGLILATPMTVCLVVLGRHVDRLEFLDVMFGDRPPLTPVENFYQRMLAGDPDEVQEQAELMLKERSLSSYYDDVALKALQLAANDYQRNSLGADQLERIRDLTQGLIAELEQYPDVPPEPKPDEDDGRSLAEREQPGTESVPPMAPSADQRAPAWRSEAPVLCVAGRGPLDEAASAMLAQLLAKHGLGARVSSFDEASRQRIADLDMTGIAMICISYLDISGNPAHLRYLLSRLRRRAPGVPLLVGLWPADDEILSNASLRQQVGADYYVVSLRQAVETCVEASAGREGTGAPKADGASRPAAAAVRAAR